MFQTHPIGTKLKQFTIKNFSQHEHDRGIAFTCDLYEGKQKIAAMKHDGCGGCNDYDFEANQSQAKINAYLNRIDFKTFLAEAYYLNANTPMYATKSKINDGNMLDDLIEYCIEYFEREKALTKLVKKSICYGNEQGYKFIGFEVTFPTLVKRHGRDTAIAAIQEAYNEVKTHLVEGERILNPETQLKQLGIIL